MSMGGCIAISINIWLKECFLYMRNGADDCCDLLSKRKC